MDTRTAPGRVGEAGVSSVQFVLASALAFLVFLALANIVVFQYGRGALRSALEQGARAGTTGGVAACESVATGVAGDLLGGRMTNDLVLSCADSDGSVVATASASFESWTPLMPDLDVRLTATAVSEP